MHEGGTVKRRTGQDVTAALQLQLQQSGPVVKQLQR